MPPNKWRRWGPIVLVQIYLGFTVAGFAWGPWEWDVPDPVALYGFLILAQLALFCGYSVGIQQPGAGYGGRFDPRRLLFLAVVVTLLSFPATSDFRTGALIPDVIGGIENPGSAYVRSAELRFGAGRMPWAEYLRFLLAPFLVLVLPLGVFYWKRLSAPLRCGVVLAVAGDIATFVASGTNKAIADLVLLFPWLLWGAHCSGNVRLSRRAVIGALVASLLGLATFFSFFASGAATRGGGSSAAANGIFAQLNVRANMDHVLIKELAPLEQVGFLGLSMYLSVGYQALALSLEEPWVPCYGIGNSLFLQRQAQRLLGVDDLSRCSYPARIEKYGWDAEGLWSSIYPWLASDLSFPGTLGAVFVVGWLFARVWRDVLVGANPFAVALFAQVIVMLFYFPANNQILQSGETLSAFCVTLYLWRRTSVTAGPCLGNRIASV